MNYMGRENSSSKSVVSVHQPHQQVHLAICLSHPIQYKSPVFRLLANQPGIQLFVYYYSNRGVVQKSNQYHGVIPAWDVPLLDGYKYQFMRNLVNEEKWKIASIQPFINPGIIKRLIADQIDVVMLHSYQYPSDWLAFIFCKIKGKEVLFYGDMYPHGRMPWLRKILHYFVSAPMIKGADACLAIGSVARQVYLDEYDVPNDRVFLAPYAVDNQSFISAVNQCRPNRIRIKEELGIHEDLPVVLCVAAMQPVKRHPDLIQAMQKIKTPARLVLVGHGPMLDEVTKLCRSLLPDTLITGFVNQSDLPRYYAIADIFVLPSRSERFGLVVNEAMCAGLPIITSAGVAASRDLVYEGENGFSFPPGDTGLLAEKINSLLVAPELRVKFGKRSLEIISNWSPEHTHLGIKQALDYIVTNKHKKARLVN